MEIFEKTKQRRSKEESFESKLFKRHGGRYKNKDKVKDLYVPQTFYEISRFENKVRYKWEIEPYALLSSISSYQSHINTKRNLKKIKNYIEKRFDAPVELYYTRSFGFNKFFHYVFVFKLGKTEMKLVYVDETYFKYKNVDYYGNPLDKELTTNDKFININQYILYSKTFNKNNVLQEYRLYSAIKHYFEDINKYNDEMEWLYD